MRKEVERNTPVRKTSCSVLKLFVLACLPFLFFCCSQDKEPSLYRFIDHFNRESILLSPFLDMASNPQEFKDKYPALHEFAAQSPLQDFGLGENPFLIKKKLKIGPVEINTLLAPPKSQYKFPVRIPAGSFLEFTYGIRRDADLVAQGTGRRDVNFTVVMETEEGREELFSKTLILDVRDDLEFNYKKIDLSSLGGKKATFYLQTRGDSKALACWFNPIIYVPQIEPKNIILISLDTLRADHLSCYGYPKDTSPNMDALARDSALFHNNFATSPWTLPSHVSLMTGLNCINHQVYFGDQKINPEILTLAESLRSEGYLNVAFTGGGYVSGLFGFNKGFDSYHMRGDVNAPHAAEIIARSSFEWIKDHTDRKFFLFIHTYQIHTPYAPPAPYDEFFLDTNAELKEADMGQLRLNHEDRYKSLPEPVRQNIIGLYDGEIRYTDEVLIKPLVRLLKDLKIYGNTMIVLTSDHGEEFYEHKSWEHNHSLYNETIKVPLIIKFFQSRHAGKKVHKYTRLTDIMPTICEELGIKLSGYSLDGESVQSLLSDKGQKEERTFLAELANNAGECRIPQKIAMNLGENKIISNENFPTEYLSYFNTPPPSSERLEIYNLGIDPEELNNAFDQDPDLSRKLLDFLDKKYRQTHSISPVKTKVDEEIERQLRALGYIR
jgi:arylsulfatase A-like enzyme